MVIVYLNENMKCPYGYLLENMYGCTIMSTKAMTKLISMIGLDYEVTERYIGLATYDNDDLYGNVWYYYTN